MCLLGLAQPVGPPWLQNGHNFLYHKTIQTCILLGKTFNWSPSADFGQVFCGQDSTHMISLQSKLEAAPDIYRDLGDWQPILPKGEWQSNTNE